MEAPPTTTTTRRMPFQRTKTIWNMTEADINVLSILRHNAEDRLAESTSFDKRNSLTQALFLMYSFYRPFRPVWRNEEGKEKADKEFALLYDDLIKLQTKPGYCDAVVKTSEKENWYKDSQPIIKRIWSLFNEIYQARHEVGLGLQVSYQTPAQEKFTRMLIK